MSLSNGSRLALSESPELVDGLKSKPEGRMSHLFGEMSGLTVRNLFLNGLEEQNHGDTEALVDSEEASAPAPESQPLTNNESPITPPQAPTPEPPLESGSC